MSRTFRLSLTQRIPLVLVSVPLLVAQAIQGTLNFAAVLIVAIVEVAVIRSTGRFGITLTADGMTAEGLRTRVVPWSAIRAIRTERMLGSRYVVVVSNSRITRLRAPITGFLQHDAAFEDKYAEVVRWWHAHRDDG